MPATTAMKLGDIQPDGKTDDESLHLRAVEPRDDAAAICPDSVWPRSGAPNGWVILDRAWARRLGVPRTAGGYRIRSHRLAMMLAPPDAPSDGAPPVPRQAGAMRSLTPR